MCPPLQQLRREAAVVAQAVDYAGHAAGHGGAGVGHAVTHRVAGAYLDGQAALLGQEHQFLRKGDHKAVKIGAGDILKMTARVNSAVKHAFHNAEIFIESFCSGESHFLIYVIIRTGNKNSSFTDSELFYKLKILFARSNPRCNFGKFKSQFLAAEKRFAILLGINKKFALSDQPVRSSELVHQRVKIYYLFYGERRC